MTNSASEFIPVSAPLLSADDEAAVLASVRQGWISSAGPAIEAFEKCWSQYCGRQFGVAVSSGTAALQVALDCLDLQPGDEVILPSLTIMSCALAILRSGAVPVPVDCTAANYLIDTAAVAAAITPRTRAIMVVHLFGHPVDMAPIWQLADRHGLAVIEDAAQAHGAAYLDAAGTAPRWRRSGGLGDIAIFSFYSNKIITTGEGGMLLTDDARIAARARSLRNLGFGASERFRHELPGWNFRMTNMQAALGVSQFSRLPQILASKHAIKARYGSLLQGVDDIVLPVQQPWAQSVCWMYAIVIAGHVGLDAAELARRLAQHGIETRPFFLGLHEQPVLRERGLFAGLQLPVTESLYRRGLYLPTGIALTPAQQERVVKALKAAIGIGEQQL